MDLVKLNFEPSFLNKCNGDVLPEIIPETGTEQIRGTNVDLLVSKKGRRSEEMALRSYVFYSDLSAGLRLFV